MPTLKTITLAVYTNQKTINILPVNVCTQVGSTIKSQRSNSSNNGGRRSTHRLHQPFALEVTIGTCQMMPPINFHNGCHQYVKTQQNKNIKMRYLNSSTINLYNNKISVYNILPLCMCKTRQLCIKMKTTKKSKQPAIFVDEFALKKKVICIFV